jgi:hypothetical protein
MAYRKAKVGRPLLLQRGNGFSIGTAAFREDQRKYRFPGNCLAVFGLDDDLPPSNDVLPCIVWHH